MESKSEVGANIKRYREEAGISQSELARRINRVPSLVSQYESGKAAPSWDTLDDIAKALNVKRIQLVDSRVQYSVLNLRPDGSVDWADESEAILLDLYRKLTPEKQEQLIRIAKTL